MEAQQLLENLIEMYAERMKELQKAIETGSTSVHTLELQGQHTSVSWAKYHTEKALKELKGEA